MNKAIRNTTWTGIGLLLTLVSGAPAIADDTELLLVDPNLTQPKPNILLIIDTSGSMGSNESTKEPYDHTIAYAGTCDATRLYWTEYDAVPSCDPGNDRMINKSAFLCTSATSQLQGVGIYSNKMVQYRSGSSGFWAFFGGGSTRWQKIAAGNPSDPVECEKDRGKHGDGIDDDDVYAQKGGNKPMFTEDDDDEISWRSFPTSQNYTMYDGNYLNYLQNTTTVTETRIGIVQQTAKVILNSIEDVNVGIMRFNNRDGGPVIAEMQDLDTNRASLISLIDSLPSTGATPVSETLYEAALYWRGMNAYYGENINETPTDPDALVSTSPEVYKAPQTEVCSKNYNVLLTDGAPNRDFETPTLAPTLPNWFATLGRTDCTGTIEGHCLDDIAEYLSKDDIDSTMDGAQTVTTHTIGFHTDLAILKETAEASGGEYFLADDIESLTLALMRIFTNINEESLSFAAPAVAVNTFNRTRNFNDLYLTAFNASEATRWPGNLKKYRIKDGQIVDANDNPAVDPNTGFFFPSTQSYWSGVVDGNDVKKGGAANELPDPASRNVYVDHSGDPNLAAGSNHLSVANEAAFTLADLGLTGSAEEPTKEEVIRWARGEDVQDEDGDPLTTVRYQMGDPLHSEPAAVVYGGTPTSPETVVYTATNEGYVHAIDGATGAELWTFIPSGHLPNLAKLYFNPDSAFKHYGVDGDIVPVVKDVDNDGAIEPGDGDFVYIIFGMRRGGDVYYMLDVTNKNAPVLKWTFSAPELGQSWSAATVARIDMADPGLNADKAVVVLGGGYDTVHDTMTYPTTPDGAGAGIYFLDLQTGNVLWRAGADTGAELTLSTMTRSIPNDIRVIDINGDGLADRMYTADMGGQIWRFDIFNGKAPDGIGSDALVTGGVIAQLGAEGLSSPTDVDTRRFYNTPDISIFNDNQQNRRFIAVSIGSGYRSHPLDNTNADRFYSIRDPNVFNKLAQTDYDGYPIVTEADLVEVSGSVGTAITDADAGWKFTLPPDQKVLADSTTFNDEIFFVAFSPDAAAASTCGAGRGKNFLYRVSVQNGDPIADLSAIVTGQEDEARVTQLAQGGIAPSPRFLFPSSDDPGCTGAECAPPPIYCVGAECDDPGFQNVPVRTLWTQDGVE